jgi:AhpD family alkylhydroperoxidase
MENRVDIKATEPQAYKAMYALEGYLTASRLTKTHRDLIKIRASQINKCAYCIDLHTLDALKNGETQQRIFLVGAWAETDLFSKEEKVILAITEELTLIHQAGLSENTYCQARKLFDDNYIAQIVIAVVTINAWNRIAVSTNMGSLIKPSISSVGSSPPQDLPIN